MGIIRLPLQNYCQEEKWENGYKTTFHRIPARGGTCRAGVSYCQHWCCYVVLPIFECHADGLFCVIAKLYGWHELLAFCKLVWVFLKIGLLLYLADHCSGMKGLSGLCWWSSWTWHEGGYQSPMSQDMFGMPLASVFKMNSHGNFLIILGSSDNWAWWEDLTLLWQLMWSYHLLWSLLQSQRLWLCGKFNAGNGKKW